MSENLKRTYKRKTDAELEQLAQDVIAGRVFTSMQCEPGEIATVFMILLFLDADDADYLKTLGISLIYEYMEAASPRSVNGLPCFLSMQYLDCEDHNKLNRRYNEIKNFLSARSAGASPEGQAP